MYVIAYDVGTTGLKSCLFSIGKGQPIKLIAAESESYDLYVLDNGGVEQDPDQWWDAMCITTPKLLQKAGLDKKDIAGISFCAQMQAVVLVDKDGKHVMNSMSYMDNRGKEQIEKLMRKGPKIAGMNAWKLLRSLQLTGAVSGSVKDPVYKYRWVADNEPEIMARTYKWLDVKDYLVCRSTGKFTMSMDSAFSTLVCDTRKGKEAFSPVVCKMMDVNMEHLPEIVLSTDNVGGMTETAAQELGLEVDDKKLHVLLLPSGCKTAEISFKTKLKTIISRSGDSIVLTISKIPTKPTEFLINNVLDIIKSIPSDKYPPITGT